MLSYLLLLPLLSFTSATDLQLTGDVWSVTGTRSNEDVMVYELKGYDFSSNSQQRSVFDLHLDCIKATSVAEASRFLEVTLYDKITMGNIIYENVDCGTSTRFEHTTFSNPGLFGSDYSLKIQGLSDINYEIKIHIKRTAITITDSKGAADDIVLQYGHLTVKSFDVTEEEIKTTEDWSYIQIRVDSPDQYFDPAHTALEDRRLVGRIAVTQNPSKLNEFKANPDTVIENVMRLKFSTFGMITVSDASLPVLAAGTWYIGVMIDPTEVPLKATVPDKNIDLTINIRTDYQYKDRVLVLFFASFIGVIIPFLARAIFDSENMNLRSIKFKMWLKTLLNWFWSGKKGLTYLTALLACLLIVSAFQVVHAKYADMKRTGDRDICYYNEKCYRPYGSYYDVSVNGIASNLPFMVAGVILVLYFSLSEAYCRSNDHKYFDYSIPYSFGLAFICEGFGSLLYHICPSQIIFQFDTLFMFVISIIMIIAIFEGNSYRDSDIKYSSILHHKAIRTPKVFAFFVGPVYFFNFIGNLIETEGLPNEFKGFFYVIFGVWWVGILLWAAYKLDLWPDKLNPQTLPKMEENDDIYSETEVTGVEGFLMQYAGVIKTVVFLLYCAIVVLGFVAAMMRKVAFSIFILGVLIVAQIVLTLVFFLPTMMTVLKYFTNIPLQIANNRCSVPKQFFILFGIIMYVLVGCVVVAISLVFFTVFSVTNKSINPWISRESNAPCYLNDFYDTHDFWHLFASFSLMMMTMVVVQISKPCRCCYRRYKIKNRARINTIRSLSIGVTNAKIKALAAFSSSGTGAVKVNPINATWSSKENNGNAEDV